MTARRRKKPSPFPAALPRSEERAAPLEVWSCKLGPADVAELERLRVEHGYPSQGAVVRAWLAASRASK